MDVCRSGAVVVVVVGCACGGGAGGSLVVEEVGSAMVMSCWGNSESLMR